jgi:hypothetical protein
MQTSYQSRRRNREATDRLVRAGLLEWKHLQTIFEQV